MAKARAKVPDRRVVKTKRALSTALIELIVEKGYEAITVQDLLDRANVGRATFYAHYENKDLLLVDNHRNLGFDFLDAEVVFPRGSAGPDFIRLFEHVAENRHLGKALLGKRSGDIFCNALRERLAVLLQDGVKGPAARSRKDRTRLTALARAAASGIVSLVTSWVDDDLPLNPDEMNELARRIAAAVQR